MEGQINSVLCGNVRGQNTKSDVRMYSLLKPRVICLYFGNIFRNSGQQLYCLWRLLINIHYKNEKSWKATVVVGYPESICYENENVVWVLATNTDSLF